jgi:hypothetical protein
MQHPALGFVIGHWSLVIHHVLPVPKHRPLPHVHQHTQRQERPERGQVARVRHAPHHAALQLKLSNQRRHIVLRRASPIPLIHTPCSLLPPARNPLLIGATFPTSGTRLPRTSGYRRSNPLLIGKVISTPYVGLRRSPLSYTLKPGHFATLWNPPPTKNPPQGDGGWASSSNPGCQADPTVLVTAPGWHKNPAAITTALSRTAHSIRPTCR